MALEWFDQARQIPAIDVARQIGEPLQVSRDRLWPCPACNEVRRSSDDRSKGPVVVRDGWRCWRCNAKGSGLDLVARVVVGVDKPDRDTWPQVRAWFAARGWCEPEEAGPDLPPARRQPRPQRRPEPPPKRNPTDEVRAVWEACWPVFTVPSTARWFMARGHGDGWRVAGLGLARALHPGVALPGWATCMGRTWWEGGWRLVLPLYSATGKLEGLRARWTGTRWDEQAQEWQEQPPPKRRKSLSARGGSPRGLLLADPIGRWLLAGRQGDPDPDASGIWWNGEVWLLEGGTDLIRWATRKDRVQPAVGGAGVEAILGYCQGAWTNELVKRIPNSSRVRLVPDCDPDGTGRRMANKIADTLRPRVASVAIINIDDVET